jgi:hypothetical protein
MMHIGIVLAAVLLLASVSRAEDPPAVQGDVPVTTTSRPERNVYGGRAGEPASLPTGLPGFGSPGPPPPLAEKAKDASPPAGAP